MADYIHPGFLKNGDKAIIVSPSGNIDPELIDKAADRLESWGLNVTTAPHAKSRSGRFCGSIEERLSDIQNAFDDDDIKLILCSRGGYGCVHILEELDFGKIKKTPKWLVGYSDITVLHQAFLANNLISVHAPMAKHLVEEDANDTASLFLRDILFGNIPGYTLKNDELNIEGKAEGILFGGNLTVLCSLAGSKYLNVPENGILFIEDVREQPYQIDRMMWTLKLSGVLDNIKGLLVGSFTQYVEDALMYKNVYESIRLMAEPLNIPVCFNFPVGHTRYNYPLPHGCRVKVETGKDTTSFKPML